MKAKSIKHMLLAAVALACGIGSVGLSPAQNVRDAVEMLRADLKADRKAIIAQEMNFSSEESQAFWPLYRNYRAEVDKVTDRLVKLVLEYADLYPDVPDPKAAQMLEQYTRIESELLTVKRKHLKKFGKVLPAAKVFRFAQLDNRLDLATRVGLAAQIPILGDSQEALAEPPR